MKLSETILFICFLFAGFLAIKKQQQCDKKDVLIQIQSTTIKFLNNEILHINDSLETNFGIKGLK